MLDSRDKNILQYQEIENVREIQVLHEKNTSYNNDDRST